LVAHARELRNAAPGIPVEPGLGEADAALVLVQGVIETQAEIERVIDAAAARPLPVGVVRKAVGVDVEIESGVRRLDVARRVCRGSLGHGSACRAEGQRRGEQRLPPCRGKFHSRPKVYRGREYVPRCVERQSVILSVRWRTQTAIELFAGER
jgi:hypothetical protein